MGTPSLAVAAEQLLEEQARTWPLLAEGLEGLKHSRTTWVDVGRTRVAVRYIPHRMKSTTAKVDAVSIRARRCFLCLANLPAEQRGVAFGSEWVLLGNPFPILDKHLTIVHREHTPQRIAGRIDALLQLAESLPGFFVFYNGPECGASAPDHLHFQACDWSLFPIADATPATDRPLLLESPARALVLHGHDRPAMVAELDRLSAALADATAKKPEPLLNLAALYDDGRFTVYVFPRAKHRPDVYLRGEILVSPAAIDLCGVLVAPRAEDAERLTGEAVQSIFDEVTLPAPLLRKVVDQLGWPT
jgi:Domain of unknown function (DUF4922)